MTKKHKITSHQKAHNGQMDQQQQDLISNLPYGLLLHILSFLDTKHAVQTCVLAKAWNGLWLSVHSLRLDSTLFTRHSFDPFVNRLLSHRNHHTSDLHHLHFSTTFAYVLDLTPHDSPIFSNLLEHSLSRNCRSFSLGHIHFLCPDIASVLPSVTSLRLHNCKFLGPKQSNSYVHYDDDNLSVDLRRRTRTWAKIVSHLNVFSNCPNLRDLSLINCRMSSSEVFEISCPKLARLTVHYPYLYDSDFNKKCKVVVSAPELTFLDIVDVSPFPMMIMAPESLSGVSFNVSTCYGKDRELKGMISMLQELRGARVLELSMLVVQVLDKVPQLLENQPLRFHNLKHLKLIANRSCRGFCVPDYVMNYIVAYSPSTKVIFAS